ncbi:MAG: hypothetical protein SFX73_00630 [Kofleriaceae bacterium]|nr:hypothetical protein [Kofleriaceae bacterium]
MSFEDIARRMEARRQQESGFGFPEAAQPAREPAPPSAPAPPRSLGDVTGAAVVQLAILTALGMIVSYVVAFVVIKLGAGGIRPVIGIPGLMVVGLAWAWSSEPVRTPERLAELGVSALVGTVLVLAAWPKPLSLTSDSKLDANVHDGVATLTVETTKRLTELPGISQQLVWWALIGCGAVAGCALVRLLKRS